MSDITVKFHELKEKVAEKLMEAKVKKEEADIIADVLVHGDARGVRSHGTIRLEHYLNRVMQKGIDINAKFELTENRPTCATMNVNGGFGHYGMYLATKEAIKQAKTKGMYAVSVYNASHCGALSYYVNMAAKEGLIAFACVNTDKCVVPFGGEKPYFGTNPIAYAFPGKKYNVLIDMATSEVAFGKVLAAREAGKEIPHTWGVDDKGVATTDPHKVVAVSPMAGYKGTAISTMVEGFTGFFTGAFGPHITTMYGEMDKLRNTGGFIFVMDPGAFGDAEVYYNSTDKFYEEIKSQPKAPGTKEMVVTGEPEERNYQESVKNGVSIYDSVAKILGM